MNPYFQSIPCGSTLPLANPHAVSVSIPSMKDLIDYEENAPGIEQIIKSGYPRFMVHPNVKQVIAHLREVHSVPAHRHMMLLSSVQSAHMVAHVFGVEVLATNASFGVILCDNDFEHKTALTEYVRHAGFLVSSRFAEDYLYAHGIITHKFQEERLENAVQAEAQIIAKLAHLYEQPDHDIQLTVSGMNAMYAVFSGIKNMQEAEGKNIFLQLGWLYTDTIQILRKFSQELIVLNQVSDENRILEIFREKGNRIAAVFTEIPTNPLVQTVNLTLVRELCTQYGIPVVVDTSVGTAVNTKLNDFADIMVESLTKFACGHGDVVAGAIVLNERSAFGLRLNDFNSYTDPPYAADLCRLGAEIETYEHRVKRISENTSRLVSYLQSRPEVENVYWCMSSGFADNYTQIARSRNSICGLLSITFHIPFARFYDAIDLPKGPSLGTNFTLLMPYVYLAHYDMIKSEPGREQLNEAGIPIDLLRISVGEEPIDEVITQFEKAFDKIKGF